MNPLAQLSPRETQLAERLAWGASVKEAAYALCITYKTAVNHVQNIYQKTGCNKINQLSAWWFCTRFNISFDLSPMYNPQNHPDEFLKRNGSAFSGGLKRSGSILSKNE